MRYFDYQEGSAAKLTRIPFSWEVGINTFLQDCALEIELDTQQEGKERINLVYAKNFMKFYKEHKEDFEAFGHFVNDYQGAYNYQWKHLYAFLHCVMMFKCEMPGKPRLLEITAHYDWVLYDLEDPAICKFVTDNFLKYTRMPEKFTDKDGTPKSIVEIMYTRLQEMNKKKEFDLTSAQSTLNTQLYHYLQPFGVGV